MGKVEDTRVERCSGPPLNGAPGFRSRNPAILQELCVSRTLDVPREDVCRSGESRMTKRGTPTVFRHAASRFGCGRVHDYRRRALIIRERALHNQVTHFTLCDVRSVVGIHVAIARVVRKSPWGAHDSF